ncbi:hypothetical protein G4B88_029532 [Cannabis sativa]|uniref:Uncharacterized protein n=1 Tax=Cannabis sativa TaxID=3483 RepID=A0A7J6E8C1_CANSA|nr:hypothetical protein G4B88_029532 [Cannabis sativa]
MIAYMLMMKVVEEDPLNGVILMRVGTFVVMEQVNLQLTFQDSNLPQI